MVLVLLLAFAVISMAQTSDVPNPNMQNQSVQPAQPSSQSYHATVKPGPVVKAGLPASADVFVNDKFALRIPASAAGMSPKQRAQVVANRLNNAFASGYTWEQMRVGETKGMYTVSIGPRLIVTADAYSARAMGISRGQLASDWAHNTVVALGGQPETIAMNLQPPVPVQTKVAGSQQEMAALNWTTENTKSVPLLFAVNGNQMGNVTVAGSQSALNNVNSVLVYQNTNGQATMWTFVPITGTTTTGTLTRVNGVGLVSVPSSLIPTGYRTGNDVMKMTTDMGSQWNSAIRTQLNTVGLPPNTNTKVIPLYSTDTNQVIGAAQIMGSTEGLREAQSVVVSTNGSMYQFGAISSQCNPMAGTPSTLNDVVVSSIIMMAPQPALAAPSAEQPAVTEPTTTEPGAACPAAPAPAPATPAAPAPAPAPAMPDEGTSGSGY